LNYYSCSLIFLHLLHVQGSISNIAYCMQYSSVSMWGWNLIWTFVFAPGYKSIENMWLKVRTLIFVSV
jgi:hypothetical protein